MLRGAFRRQLLSATRQANKQPLDRQEMLQLDQQIKDKILHQDEGFQFDTDKFKEGLKSAYMAMT